MLSKKKSKILLIDDEKNIHYSFKRLFTNENVEFSSCYDGEEGLKRVNEKEWDLVITDIRMPKLDGLTLLQKIKENNPKLLVIVITAHGTMDTAIEAMKFGAYDYLVKPFDNDRLKELVIKALHESKQMKSAVEVMSDIPETSSDNDVIIGVSSQMQEIYKMIGQVASKEITVLVTGESGTGKELIARAIYSHSQRKDKIFTAVNCAAIPENLLESELFGHEKGSFTGADSLHIGRFENTKGGTLFLDEIGDMSFNLQAKLLRVLQTGDFQRVGGNDLIKTDVRIITATNKELKKEVEKGNFREDLYYRLNVVNIHLPPLRNRKNDIKMLIEYFVKRFSSKYEKQITGISETAKQKLLDYNYPGNVRELENIINRAVVVASSDLLTEKEIKIVKEEKTSKAFENSINVLIDKLLKEILSVSEEHREEVFPTIEKLLIEKVLEKTGNNQVKTSKMLGISRNTLRKRMERYGLI